MGEFKDELIKSMLERKAGENNTIDLNAYALGLDEMFDKIARDKKSSWVSVKDQLPNPQIKVRVSYGLVGIRAAVVDDWESTGWLTKSGVWSIKQNGTVPKGAKPSHWKYLTKL